MIIPYMNSVCLVISAALLDLWLTWMNWGPRVLHIVHTKVYTAQWCSWALHVLGVSTGQLNSKRVLFGVSQSSA